jgi:ribosomal-protein-serine acetyltransferase
MYAFPLAPGAELRPLEPWHAEEFLANLDRCREHIQPWVGPSFVATDLDSARAGLQRYADRRAKEGGGIHGIWLDGVLVGGVLFVSVDAEGGGCEIGCWLEPSAEGRGLVTRACAHLIDWAVRERDIVRVEWQTLAGNEPSKRVAQRLGMTRDGVLRSAVPPRAGGDNRSDLEIWAVLRDDWLARAADPDLAEIDALTAAFYRAFDSSAPDVASIYQLFVPSGQIIYGGGPEQRIYDLRSFIEPRERMLGDGGELTEFHEEETAHRTEILGSVAIRQGRYSKSGRLRGEPFTGRGSKTIQFLRTPDGWRMTALSWDDDR